MRTIHSSGTNKRDNKKELILDTGSPVTIMPPDKRIMEKIKIRKITNQYRNVNKNEETFRE